MIRDFPNDRNWTKLNFKATEVGRSIYLLKPGKMEQEKNGFHFQMKYTLKILFLSITQLLGGGGAG